MTPDNLSFTISDLQPDDAPAIRQAAQLLVDEFRNMAPDAWPTLDRALETVREALTEGQICRVARAVSAAGGSDGTVLGWIGGAPQYDGHVWELHPLVVARAHQRRGIGQALVADLESLVAARNAQTLWVGADDEDGRTTLGNVDLYDDLPRRLQDVRNPGGHPLGFYQRLGFTIVGVLPDANGPGRPDIFLAKRVTSP
jgi:aminoglycoside 6'-N-acetyltransferase I